MNDQISQQMAEVNEHPELDLPAFLAREEAKPVNKEFVQDKTDVGSEEDKKEEPTLQ